MEDNGWKLVSASPVEASKIESVRDDMFKICPPEKYRKIDPHITLIPPFRIKDKSRYPEINSAINQLDFNSCEFTVNGASIYPSLQNPRVILLDITPSKELLDIREHILDVINDYDVEFWYEPAPLHITLFKCDNGYTLADDRKDLLQETIWDNRDSWTGTIEYIDLVCTVSDN